MRNIQNDLEVEKADIAFRLARQKRQCENLNIEAEILDEAKKNVYLAYKVAKFTSDIPPSLFEELDKLAENNLMTESPQSDVYFWAVQYFVFSGQTEKLATLLNRHE